ncbi:hypothetical protein C8Q79DRAFT_971200 [Trametes meyenii]|nr:hypothetical protein C8Q79DRAFT_971200 [Trametes meyenii]
MSRLSSIDLLIDDSNSETGSVSSASNGSGAPRSRAAGPSRFPRKLVQLLGLSSASSSELSVEISQFEALQPDTPPMSEPAASRSRLLNAGTPSSKRRLALLELVSSERAYASHLAFIRDVSIPLALGTPLADIIPAQLISPYRTMSITSEISASYSLLSDGPAMTPDDVKVIFSNVEELASFSATFADDLEEALALESDKSLNSDRVGKTFLARISTLQTLYQTYTAKHPAAIERFNGLPESPALKMYISQTWVLASNLSNVRDLPSLLFKPVQRLLQYLSLLDAIFDETPLTHNDKEDLRAARAKIEQIAFAADESRIRRAVVQEVLAGPTDGMVLKFSGVRAKYVGPKLRSSTPIIVGRNKKPRIEVRHTEMGVDSELGREETTKVRRLGEIVAKHRSVIQRLMEDIPMWIDSVCALTSSLGDWATKFEGMIILDSLLHSEPLEAFQGLILDNLVSLCNEARECLEKLVQPELAQLLQTTQSPWRLIEAMRALEPLHFHLPEVQNLSLLRQPRPSPQMLDASQAYVALRAQLSSELPAYMRLLEKGIVLCVSHLASIQSDLYSGLRQCWFDFWEAIEKDSREDVRTSAEETIRSWKNRFRDPDAALKAFQIVRPPSIRPVRPSFSVPHGRPAFSISSDSTPTPRFSSSSEPHGTGPIVSASVSTSPSTSASSSDTYSLSSALTRIIVEATRSGGERCPALYKCRVVHPCEPPPGVSYRELPFLALRTGDLYDILAEADHPSAHLSLPMHMDDGEPDCLLVARDDKGKIGWVLASFLIPVT